MLPARQSSPHPQRTKRADFSKASTKVTAVNSNEYQPQKSAAQMKSTHTYHLLYGLTPLKQQTNFGQKLSRPIK